MGGGLCVEEGARLSIPNGVLIHCVPLGLSSPLWSVVTHDSWPVSGLLMYL